MRRNATVFIVIALISGLVRAGDAYGQSFKNFRKDRSRDGVLAKPLDKSDLDEMARRLKERPAGRNAGAGPSPASRNIQQSISAVSGPLDVSDTRIWRDKNTDLPYFVVGNWSPDEKTLEKTTAQDRVFRFLSENKSLLRLNSPAEEFRVRKTVRDNLGEIHLRLQQTYRGLDVWGKDIVVHVAVDGGIRGFNGRYTHTPVEIVDITERISPEEAVDIVEADLNVKEAEIDECQKKIYVASEGDAVLVWHVVIRFGFERWYYFIDAKTGDVVHRIDYTMTDGPTTGTGFDLAGVQQTVQLYEMGTTYYMIDCSKPMFNAFQSQIPDNVSGGIVVFDIRNELPEENVWLYYVMSNSKTNWPANAVSLEVNVGKAYDYYYTVHGRNSIDGQGMTVYSTTNLGDNYNNAYWNGKALWFGNGDGVQFSDICGALDVVAHEFTHGVTQYTSNLIYEFQSGALNEALSDIFGALTEWHHEGASGDWLIGEDVTTPAIPGDGLRDMADPSGPNSVSKLPSKMSEYVSLPNTKEGDWGGVHRNCSIISRAAVLIAQSIGKEKMGRIFYRAQTAYLTQSSEFIDARLACVEAVKDFPDMGNAEERAVKDAFDAVEIFGGNPTPPPPEHPPVLGEQWILAVEFSTKALYRCRPVIVNPNTDIQLLTQTRIFENCRPSVTDDGLTVLFVDENFDLMAMGTDGTDETNISQGLYDFWSIAVSPDEHWLAFTSTAADASIYILDLIGDDHRTHRLYSPVTWGTEPTYDVAYADALDWTLDSQYLLYDCYHESPTNSEALAFWSINLLNAGSGEIYNIFPYQPVGVNIGNPVFASNSEYIFAYDYADAWGNTAILAANMETGDEGIIMADNFGKIGYPTYNPEDNMIAFHTSVLSPLGWFVDGIGQIQLEPDKINGKAATAAVYLVDATFPVWFAIGNRAEVETDEPILPLCPELGENYPNPFNPETVIPFQVSEQSPVHLSVYNLKGEEVAVLVDEALVPGRYKIRWQGMDREGRMAPSGVYIYRLEIGEKYFSRKMILVR